MKTTLAVTIIGLVTIGAARASPRADEIRSAQETPATPAGQRSSRSVWDGVYTQEQARRGAAVYNEHCTSCHGPQLEGGETAGPLVGGQFTSNWNGVSVGDMLERTRMSMPQDHPGTLSRQKIADVIAYVFSANRFPAGKTELTRQPELAKQIKFEAVKPTR